jgi:hypothetical protein
MMVYLSYTLCSYDVVRPSFQHLPDYLKTTNYVLPTRGTDGPFQAAHQTRLPVFAWLDQTPPYLDAFNSYMSAYRAGKLSWADPRVYPVSDRLINGFDAGYSDTFLVDVGGGRGHDLHELKVLYPDIPGKLVLEDRPGVVANVSDDAFEVIPHDFFTPQPVKHARAYYLHSILHNWSDEDCIRILQQLKPAMRPGYSKLLLNEIVVAPRNTCWPVTSIDQVMLVIAARQERTEQHLAGLLSQAGFTLVKTYSHKIGHESLLEAVLEEDCM